MALGHRHQKSVLVSVCAQTARPPDVHKHVLNRDFKMKLRALLAQRSLCGAGPSVGSTRVRVPVSIKLQQMAVSGL